MVKKTEHIPIMSDEEERYMAFSGLVQWTQAVIIQAVRVTLATEQIRIEVEKSDRNIDVSSFIYDSHCQAHYFIIAANKLLEHRRWITKFGLCKSVNFSEIDAFSKQDIIDLRNMREHVVNYFMGDGRDKDRWVTETPEYKADASSRVGNMLGGKLDYIKFSEAAERLLTQLKKEPVPRISGM
jgi:hypothetical protein